MKNVLEYGFMRKRRRTKGKKKRKTNLFWIRPWKRKASNSQHPRGWMGKPEYPGKKPVGRMHCKPYDINLDEGFTAIKAQENNNKNNNNNNKEQREGERETHTHIYSHTIVLAYIRTNAVLWKATVKASEEVGGGRKKEKKINSIIKATWGWNRHQPSDIIFITSHRHCHANNLPSIEQAVKNSTKTRSVFIFNFSSFLTVYLLLKCRFVAW